MNPNIQLHQIGSTSVEKLNVIGFFIMTLVQYTSTSHFVASCKGLYQIAHVGYELVNHRIQRFVVIFFHMVFSWHCLN
jgi:hypothetical protein